MANNLKKFKVILIDENKTKMSITIEANNKEDAKEKALRILIGKRTFDNSDEYIDIKIEIIE